MTSTPAADLPSHPRPAAAPHGSRASRASLPPLPAAAERWLGDPRPGGPDQRARRSQGLGSIAAVGAVVLTSVVGMNALQSHAGTGEAGGPGGGFGGPPTGAGFTGPGAATAPAGATAPSPLSSPTPA